MRLLIVVCVLLLTACEPPGPPSTEGLQFGTALNAERQDAYSRTCARCHRSNAPGLPRSGDPSDWAPLLEQGFDTLVQHAIEGYHGMPAKGLCGYCSDEDIRAMVAYMAGIDLDAIAQ